MKQQYKNIEELFKDKLHNLEADPGVNAWSNVQTGLSSTAASSTAAATGGSWASTVIVGAVITAVAVSGFFFFNNEGEKLAQPKQQNTEVNENTNSESASNTEISVPLETPEAKQAVDVSAGNNGNEKSPNAVSSVATTENVAKKAELTKEDVSDQVDYEKTIDEILAEHQEFLETQTTNSSSLETEEDKLASQLEETSTQKTENSKETVASSQTSPSNTIAQEVIDARTEQRRIAGQVVFPNVFTPDLDGNNDVFKMTVEKSIQVENIQVDILDVNRNVIATWTGIYEGWDGTLKDGSLAPAGSYFYQAIIVVDGKQIPKVEGFTLRR